MAGTNHLIKQIGQTTYGYDNSHNYFFKIRLQLFNRHQIKANVMNLLTQKAPNKELLSLEWCFNTVKYPLPLISFNYQ